MAPAPEARTKTIGESSSSRRFGRRVAAGALTGCCGGRNWRGRRRCRCAAVRRGFAVRAATASGCRVPGFGGLRSVLAPPKIGHVPARTLELEAGRCELLCEARSPALRTIRQWRIGQFLQDILGIPAGLAFIGVDWHGALRFWLKNCTLK